MIPTMTPDAMTTVATSKVEYEDGAALVSGLAALVVPVDGSLGETMARLRATLGADRLDGILVGEGREQARRDWEAAEITRDRLDRLRLTLGKQGAAGQGVHELVSHDGTSRAVFRCLDTWEASYQRALGVCWGSSFQAGWLAGLCSHWLEAPCEAEQTSFGARSGAHDEFTVTAQARVSRQPEAPPSEKGASIEEARRGNVELLQLNRDLRDQIRYLEQQAEGAHQPTPILQVAPGVLTLSITGAIDQDRGLRITAHLLEAIVQSRSHFTILDITGVTAVELMTVDQIVKLIRVVAMIGARCVLVGVQPGVARRIVDVGVGMTDVITLSNLEEAVRHCRERAGRGLELGRLR
jgi:rsbT co-antagonist protein RsbR